MNTPVAPAPRTVGPVTLTDVVRFAGASGDFNPLHHDDEAARAAGFEAPLAMGQYTAGLVAAWLTDWCGVGALRRLEVRFTAPLHLGDVVTMSAEPTGVEGGSQVLSLTAAGLETVLVTGTAHVSGPAPLTPPD